MNYGNAWGFGPSPVMGTLSAIFGGLILPLALWSLAWKGWALWKAARAGSKVWYVVLLLVNTLGILEILYIFLFSGNKTSVAPVRTTKLAKRRKK